MGQHNLDLERLSGYIGISINELQKKSYSELMRMMEKMEYEKIIEHNNRNAQDDEYERLVLKYFTPLPLLRHWFSDREVVLACAMTGVTERDLCGEALVEPGRRACHKDAEYLRTSWEYVRQYDRYGRELAERERKKMDVYRVKHQYQGLRHARVIMYLLTRRYPELSWFHFDAYEVHGTTDYEIYPKNGIYTSFAALMSGDIDWILHRNREYCARYNNGRYSPKECEKAFRTDNARKMFALIHEIGGKEYNAGHSPFYIDGDGNYAHAGRLVQSKVSESGSIVLLEDQSKVRDGWADPEHPYNFKLCVGATHSLAQLVERFLELIKDNASRVHLHVYHTTDYLGEHGINASFGLAEGLDPKVFVCSLPDNDAFDCSSYFVEGTFGWSKRSEYDLTVRIDCPQIGG